MDTRSKKFDRTFITKPVAFILAVLLAVFAVVFTLSKAVGLKDSVDGAGIYAEDVLRGVDSGDITRLWAFANENRTVQTYALQRFLYGDGSKKAYETYQKKQQEVSFDRVKPVRETILQNCKGESGHGSPAAIFAYLRESLVTLRKLDDHEKHVLPDGQRLEVYDYGVTLTLDNDDGEYDVEVYRYDDGEFDDFEDAPTEMYTTTFADVTHPRRQSSNSDLNYQSKSKTPKKIKDQLQSGEIAVELCRTRFVDSETSYDGYYALSVNEDVLASRYNSSRTNYGSPFASYETYLDAYDNARRLTNAYKNMQFAVVDNKTGFAVSNVEALDGKTLTRDELRPFTKSEWNYRIDLLTGELTLSDAAESDLRKNAYLSSQSTLDFLQPGEVNATLYVTFDKTLSKSDVFKDHLKNDATVYFEIWQTLTVDLLCLAGILICVIYLIIRAGRRANDDELHMMKTDRIFTGLRTVLNLGAAVGFGAIAFCIVEYFFTEGVGARILMTTGVGLCAAAVAALGLDWLLYLVRHIKNGTLFSNFFAVWLWKKGRALLQKIKASLAARPKIVRDLLNDILRRALFMAVLPNIAVGILAVLFAGGDRWGVTFLLLLLLFAYDCFLIGYICFYAYHLRTVIAAVHRMREGDMNVQIDTAKMPPAVKAFADDVVELQRGLQTAVDNALRDERTKTELITNVSHDLKTPLTSIINYIDLLQRCNIEDETAREYLRVLGEKSERLKKLIEDLVEASKASAGAVKTELTTVSLNELAAQIAGEYADAFAERGLILITQEAQENILVRADGKLSYRVLDNLMGNIKKYAMPGTRVYLTLEQKDGRGILTLRNISEQALGIPVEELRERFVRGDRSRSTEGSGLGLSIAEDLCRLQGAELSLSVDGDLFTASVGFQSAPSVTVAQ